jgi:hypothetical protein
MEPECTENDMGRDCDYAADIKCRCAPPLGGSPHWECAEGSGDHFCPAAQPRTGWACGGLAATAWQYSGSSCRYGAVTCECRSLGQNSSAWSCGPDGSDAAVAGR